MAASEGPAGKARKLWLEGGTEENTYYFLPLPLTHQFQPVLAIDPYNSCLVFQSQ